MNSRLDAARALNEEVNVRTFLFQYDNPQNRMNNLGPAMRHLLAVFVMLLIAAAPSFAHYNMLLPDKPRAQKDEKVAFIYQFGHPFEHELFDAPKPASLMVHLPSGKLEKLDLDKLLTKTEVPGADGKKVAAWRFDYTPAERGDHVFLLKTARIKHEEGKFLEDTVKVVLHVQTQNGWAWSSLNAGFESGLDIVPFTRPYGFRAGMVFRGKIVSFPADRRHQGCDRSAFILSPRRNREVQQQAE